MHQKIGNLDEMDQVLERHKLPGLIQEEWSIQYNTQMMM